MSSKNPRGPLPSLLRAERANGSRIWLATAASPFIVNDSEIVYKKDLGVHKANRSPISQTESRNFDRGAQNMVQHVPRHIPPKYRRCKLLRDTPQAPNESLLKVGDRSRAGRCYGF